MAQKRTYLSVRMRINQGGRHLSGAEDLLLPHELEARFRDFTGRFFPFMEETDEAGARPALHVTVDPVPEDSLLKKFLLPVQQLSSRSGQETEKTLLELLAELVPIRAGKKILDYFRSGILEGPVRSGACLIDIEGRPFPGPPEGVRTSHVGCLPELRREIERVIVQSLPTPNYRFTEALVLASKVLSHPEILCEICASDDPLYTTGYMASRRHGYVRIPHMKEMRHSGGGRLYVVLQGTEIPGLLSYLRATPVLFHGQMPGIVPGNHRKLLPLPSVNHDFDAVETCSE